MAFKRFIIGIILLFGINHGTVNLYFDKYGCKEPNLNDVYMGQNVIESNELSLAIHGWYPNEFEGYWDGNEYNIHVWGKEYQQYIAYIKHGFINDDLAINKCNNTLILIEDPDREMKFKWKSPKNEDNIESVEIIVVSAPNYVPVRYQKFKINQYKANIINYDTTTMNVNNKHEI